MHFSVFQPLSWKVTFSGTQKPTPPIVFNLQASDWVHFKEKQVHIQESLWQNYKSYFLFYKFLKLFILPEKNTRISKNSIKFIIIFFFKMTVLYKYIFIKCIDNSNFL